MGKSQSKEQHSSLIKNLYNNNTARMTQQGLENKDQGIISCKTIANIESQADDDFEDFVSILPQLPSIRTLESVASKARKNSDNKNLQISYKNSGIPVLAKRSNSAPVVLRFMTDVTSSMSHLDINFNKIPQEKTEREKPETKFVVHELTPTMKQEITPTLLKIPNSTQNIASNVVTINPNFAATSPSKSPSHTNPIPLIRTATYTKLSSANPSSTGSSSSTSSSTKKKLVVRGLRKFVNSRGSCPPSWVRDFPCKSRYHPETYLYDWDEGPNATRRPVEAMGKCFKKSARCGTCGIYSEDSCRCCTKCPLDCTCPKPPNQIPDVMSQAFGPGWNQAKKVICELTDSDRKSPVGGNAAKMNRGIFQYGDQGPPHLQCSMDFLNPLRPPNAEPAAGSNLTTPNQPYYPNQGPPSYYSTPPPAFCYYPQPPPPMYPAYYPPPPMSSYAMPPPYQTYQPQPPPPPYYSDQNYSMIPPYPPPQNY